MHFYHSVVKVTHIWEVIKKEKKMDKLQIIRGKK